MVSLNKLEKMTVLKWDEEEFIQRAERCRTLLVIHGLLSETESQNVKKRIEKKRREIEGDSDGK